MGTDGLKVLVGLWFRVRDRVGVRVSDGVRLEYFTFCHPSSPQEPTSPHF